MTEEIRGKVPTLPWLTVKGGNSRLPLALAEKLKNEVQYGHCLKTIIQEEKEIILKFGHGIEVQTDIVLLAIPCSIFQNIQFKGQLLDSSRWNRIKSIQYGTNAKILRPCNTQEKQDFFMSPTMASWTNYTKDVRTFYYGGKFGQLTAGEYKTLLGKDLRVMNSIYPAMKCNLNSLENAKDNQFHTYQGNVFKCWSLDPYAKGSYTNRSPQTASWLTDLTEVKGEKVRALFQPIQDRIFFAGEHATILDAFGTLEGAIESGERMARLIHKTLHRD
jgi:monoamine oxidase